MTAPDPQPKSILNTEITTELKDRLARYAQTEGMSMAAATRVLLHDALTRAGYPRETTR